MVETAERVEVDLDSMRSCLAEGYPFAFGLQLFSSFQTVGATGLVPMPDPDREKHDGGHAMLCVGYSDRDQVFIVRNSWGEDWGDRGYCYIPYAYMTSADLNSDCWAIHQVSEPVDFSQDIVGDDSSLFSDAIAAIVESIQTPGIAFLESFFNTEQTVIYEEEYLYTDEGFVPVDEIEDIESYYYWEETEDYSEETEDSYEEDSEEEYSEETEDSYEAESEECSEDIEDGYDEVTDEYSEDEYDESESSDQEEEIVDNYEDEESDEEDYTEEDDTEAEAIEDSHEEEEYAEEEYIEEEN